MKAFIIFLILWILCDILSLIITIKMIYKKGVMTGIDLAGIFVCIICGPGMLLGYGMTIISDKIIWRKKR